MLHLQGRRSEYWMTWAASLLFFGAFYTLLVPLPRYLVNINLPDWQVGVVLGVFGIASLVGRSAGWRVERHMGRAARAAVWCGGTHRGRG